MPLPRATARLQFHKDFGFDDALRRVGYFSDLGISHLYASPIFTARRGSTHGYDVVDPGSINPELGGMAGLERLVAALRAADMGLIIDIVPNHMGIAGAENRWWEDVLELGQASAHASWFDIDWQRDDPAFRGKVLLPFLGEQYGVELEDGAFALKFDADARKIYLDYRGNRFPISPASYAQILGGAGSELLAAAAEPAGRAVLDACLAAYDTGTPAGRAAMHALLEAQHYRLAWWRFGADSLNWRRFFEVTELAGIRSEHDPVFDATHALALDLYARGMIDGVRVDHVDGLADPTGYCRRLRRSLEARAASRPADAPTGPAYIVVEKILAAGEPLRPEWQVDGTTGYDFMDQVGAFLHDPRGEAMLSATWDDLLPKAEQVVVGIDEAGAVGDTGTGTGTGTDGDADTDPDAQPGSPVKDDGNDIDHVFEAEVQAARRLLLSQNLAAEMDTACRALQDLARTELTTRDYAFNTIKRVFTELLVQFPVYRTYVWGGVRDATDQAVFDLASTRASRHVGAADAPLLAQLGAWLGGELPARGQSVDFNETRNRAIRRFQQLTPPLVAKSVEDTAFYRYGRLLSRNQVGSNPAQFALSAEEFHAACVTRAAAVPHAMLATATHDHKRGEDVTARLAVFSEVALEWRDRLDRWRRMNARCRSLAARAAGAPSPAEEAMLYQTLIGVWPLDLRADDAAGVAALCERLATWQEKALREAKSHSDWVLADAGYEAACREFLQAIMRTDTDNLFLEELAEWVRYIAVAGVVNSLTQTVLRLTVPGVPDLYQGSEFWDLSLVDPDNRRPVDFEARSAALAQAGTQPIAATPWRSGALKQRIVQALLLLRRDLPDLFAEGDYRPLQIEGPAADTLLAFARGAGSEEIVVIVSHLVSALTLGSDAPFIDAAAWRDTLVRLPRAESSVWQSVLGQATLKLSDDALPVGVALNGMTVAVLRRMARQSGF